MDALTKNFSLSEFAVSADYPELAQDIRFSPVDRQKAFYLSSTLLQPARDYMGSSMAILSGKRTPLLNKKVSGVVNSEHLWQDDACACDVALKKNFQKMWDIYEFLMGECQHGFGQMIIYLRSSGSFTIPRFIHISIATDIYRGECLVKLPDGTYVVYSPTKDYGRK